SLAAACCSRASARALAISAYDGAGGPLGSAALSGAPHSPQNFIAGAFAFRHRLHLMEEPPDEPAVGDPSSRSSAAVHSPYHQRHHSSGLLCSLRKRRPRLSQRSPCPSIRRPPHQCVRTRPAATRV